PSRQHGLQGVPVGYEFPAGAEEACAGHCQHVSEPADRNQHRRQDEGQACESCVFLENVRGGDFVRDRSSDSDQACGCTLLVSQGTYSLWTAVQRLAPLNSPSPNYAANFITPAAPKESSPRQ